MGKNRTLYLCQNCGFASPKWLGRCPDCEAWNSFVEEAVRSRTNAPQETLCAEDLSPQPVTSVMGSDETRMATGLGEFDRVLGGGVVPGSLILVGGDPGIGKSTLLLQASHAVARQGGTVLYVSGEESLRQIKLRAERLGVDSERLLLLAHHDAEAIIGHIERLAPAMTVVDSIQTTLSPHLESAPGSISQVRECAAMFMHVAKRRQTSVFLIGHVTKDGAIAGPRAMEHIVDTVLYFEGERHHAFRILRAVKNRFGSTNEIGVFEMGQDGLRQVLNPSQLFLAERPEHVPGSVVVCCLEGTRPMLVELQALVTPTKYGIPQRVVNGIDQRRLSLLLAVMEKRAGLMLGNQDVYVNVAGGVRVDEPAVDLGTVLSVASSYRNLPVEPKTVVCGEVGLGGEIRAISQIEKRIGEAAKLGFSRCLCPASNARDVKKVQPITVTGVKTVSDALKVMINDE
jgi:DNA repair protein RadA/Sms